MGIPAIQKKCIGAYILKQKLTGVKRYPLVLMLEPLFLCNLSCRGCGKVSYPKDILEKRLSIQECVHAAEECEAPVISIPGGEPLLHPDIAEIVRELTAMKKFVYLCTNGLLVKKRLKEFQPSQYLTFNVHLDGFAERHDYLVNRQGVFDTAVAAIRLLTAQGYRVTTNTTFYYGETPDNAALFLDFLSTLGIEGMTVAPCFTYEKASDKDMGLTREATWELFRSLLGNGKKRKWFFNHSTLYLDFLTGMHDYDCTPWGNPTRNIFGWQKPCYLLNDGYAATFRELMDSTEWKNYGAGKDPRCSDCMIHCGFEPTAVEDAFSNPLKALKSSARRSFSKKSLGKKRS